VTTDKKLHMSAIFPTFVWPDTQQTEPLDKIDACLALCEEYGWDIWTVDHLLVAPGLYGATWLDVLPFLTYAAGKTETIMLGTSILVLPVRQPVLLAKEIGTLQLLSNNRFNLGVGPGWHANEYASVGAHISERGKRTDEVLEALEVLLTTEGASYHGKYYNFDDVTMVPRPGMPPVWVAGGSRIPDPGERDLPDIAKSVLDRVVKSRKWLSRASGKQEWVKSDWLKIVAHAEKTGVDPDELIFGHCNWYYLTDEKDHDKAVAKQAPFFQRVMGTHRPLEQLQECYLFGTTEEIIERLRDLIAAGCTYLNVGPNVADPEQFERFRTEVLPHLS
jgi:alkanesulfonate monooxygenase SsuD/methylene tetrahydromethanopterin reductase-like flavin-dependent oxidoreductase (luciferase family)